jgi:FixJ family two-component response regulator
MSIRNWAGPERSTRRSAARDFLTKHAPKEELLDAVKRALASDTRERAERARLEALRAPFAALTSREREVLAHVLTGQLNKQIAGDLGVDERSVKRHRTSIMTKLRVQSVTELTRLVQEAGLWSGGNLSCNLGLAPGSRMSPAWFSESRLTR